MNFKLPEYNEPNWNSEMLINAPDVELKMVEIDGVLPNGFHLSTIYPEYLKIDGEWILIRDNIPYTVFVVRGRDVEAIEPNMVLEGDRIVCARTIDGSEGVYVNEKPFDDMNPDFKLLPYDKSGSDKYEKLYALLQHEKNSKYGYIVWVLGPAVVFDYDTRVALSELMENGYIDSILAGNAMATHDLEGGYLETALGQNIYTQESLPNGHYNHLDTINEARRLGSIESFVKSGEVEDGLMKKAVEMRMPYVLAGSIRDDGPLPSVHANVNDSIYAMEKELKKATLVITLATQLHSVSAASMLSSYKLEGDRLRPVYIFSIDITDYAVSSVSRARDDFGVESFLTNVQDFSYILKKNLIK